MNKPFSMLWDYHLDVFAFFSIQSVGTELYSQIALSVKNVAYLKVVKAIAKLGPFSQLYIFRYDQDVWAPIMSADTESLFLVYKS